MLAFWNAAAGSSLEPRTYRWTVDGWLAPAEYRAHARIRAERILDAARERELAGGDPCKSG